MHKHPGKKKLIEHEKMDHPQKRTTIIPKHKTSKPISKQTSKSGEKTSLFVVQHMAHNIFPGDEIAEKGIHEM